MTPTTLLLTLAGLIVVALVWEARNDHKIQRLRTQRRIKTWA